MKRKLHKRRAIFLAVLCFALCCPALAEEVAHGSAEATHRYVVERSFPKGALDGLDAAQKEKVNQTNARFGVRWVMSYATPDKTKTYCIYVAPNETAIRNAAKANQLPVDSISEVPVTLEAH